MLVLIVAAPAGAADTRVHARLEGWPAPAAGNAFGLHLETGELDVDYDDDRGGGPLEVDRAGIEWFEPLGAGTRLGFALGRQRLDQNGRAATAGITLHGHYGTLRFDGGWSVVGEHVGVEISADLRYGEVDGAAGADETELEWLSLALRPAVVARLGDVVDVRGGLRARWLDGDERTRGPGGRGTGFDQDGVAGVFGGLTIHTGDTGRIHLRVDGGPASGGRITFERRY